MRLCGTGPVIFEAGRERVKALRPGITRVLLWLLQLINQTKDRRLADILHKLADEYDPAPTGDWK